MWLAGKFLCSVSNLLLYYIYNILNISDLDLLKFEKLAKL